ncbi:hypothetical protein [Roseovarius aestuarii]|uniref:Uncharacterized protein n=2 Tax=Roseovarius aestuarii TaxID=475083 RepID=A0A1X7BXB5_9RHOB|nr:hypothetical protein [Roseovarius aestuarii]SMC13899.1 hypothetical protein ROA7745_03761 [Roseovarius aestuarii]
MACNPCEQRPGARHRYPARLTDAEIRAFNMLVSGFIDELANLLDGELGDALQRVANGAAPIAGVVFALIRALLTTPELRARFKGLVFQLVTVFVTGLPGTDDDLFTSFVLSGGFFNDGIGNQRTGFMRVFGGFEGQSTPASADVANNLPSGEVFDTIGSFEVREIPVNSSRGRYTSTQFVAIRDTLAPPVGVL